MHVYISSYLQIRTIQMSLIDNESYSSSLSSFFRFAKKEEKKEKFHTNDFLMFITPTV